MPETAEQKHIKKIAHEEIVRRMGSERTKCEECEHLAYCREIEPTGSPLPCTLSSETVGNIKEPSNAYHAPPGDYEYPVHGKLRLPGIRGKSLYPNKDRT